MAPATLMRAAALAVVLVLVVGVGSGGARTARITTLQPIVSGLVSPTYVATPPGDPGTLYVVEQAGRILVLTNGHIRNAPFLDIRSQVRSGEEQGLLSVAFAPDYAQSHRFYVDYTDSNGDTRVVQYRSNGTSAIASSAKQLLFVKDFAANHNGGQLQFGPDKRLYWGNGDGGGGGDPQHNGQSLARPFAKMIRQNFLLTGQNHVGGLLLHVLLHQRQSDPWQVSAERLKTLQQRAVQRTKKAGDALHIQDVD